MFIYKTLENISLEKLHMAFVDAFSDYQVKIDLPFWKFDQMLERRGYISSISMGAFEDEKLVGFVLNGLRNWNGKLTVYDIGTGVIGQYRKKGITTNMISKIKKLVSEKKVEQYLLEAIQSNTSAVELYKNQGFEIIRNFGCFQFDKNKYKIELARDYKVQHIDKIDLEQWSQIRNFWDFMPSWQNSIDSINSAADIFVYSVINFDDTIVGYGIIDKKTGDIPQIGVNKDFRNRGIARNILLDLANNTQASKISILNIDDRDKNMKEILFKFGFEYTVGQYEMLLKLNNY